MRPIQSIENEKLPGVMNRIVCNIGYNVMQKP